MTLPVDAHDPAADARDRRARFGELRASLAVAHREAAPEAFVRGGDDAVPCLATGLAELDAALGGGFPTGAISTLEGGVGASAIALRMLAHGTRRGLAALVELPDGPEGRLLPQALAVAGVDLARLLVVPAKDATGVARAVDVLLRSAAFGVVVIPPVILAQTVWTRLASLAHRADVVLLTAGGTASPELRFFASLRVRTRPARIRWNGDGGIFATLAGIDVEATVLKHKRATPGRSATFRCTSFEHAPPGGALRERAFETSDEFAPRRTALAG